MLAQLGNAIALVLLPFLQLNLEVDLVEKDPSMRQVLNIASGSAFFTPNWCFRISFLSGVL